MTMPLAVARAYGGEDVEGNTPSVGEDGEIGAVRRVRRYMENRQADRVARQTRINAVTSNLMQSL